ncbi:hypothetical protein D3C84_1277320 [compost metagenome]
MQAIAGIEVRIESGRVRRILRHRVEVDHRVEGTALSDPDIELATQSILVNVVVVVQGRTG